MCLLPNLVAVQWALAKDRTKAKTTKDGRCLKPSVMYLDQNSYTLILQNPNTHTLANTMMDVQPLTHAVLCGLVCGRLKCHYEIVSQWCLHARPWVFCPLIRVAMIFAHVHTIIAPNATAAASAAKEAGKGKKSKGTASSYADSSGGSLPVPSWFPPASLPVAVWLKTALPVHNGFWH